MTPSNSLAYWKGPSTSLWVIDSWLIRFIIIGVTTVSTLLVKMINWHYWWLANMLRTTGMRRITISNILLRHSGMMSMHMIIPARRGRLATHLIQRRRPPMRINIRWNVSLVVTLIILIRRS